MAFGFVITASGVMGDKAYAYGTFDAASATSGSIVTGLSAIEHSSIVNKTTAGAGLIDDTTTAGTIAVSALTTSDTGTWIAFGRK